MCPRSRRLRIQHRSSISTAWTWRGRRNLRHANLVGILGQRSFSPPAIPPTTNCAKLHHPIAERRAAKLQRCNRPTHFRTLALCVRSETPKAHRTMTPTRVRDLRLVRRACPPTKHKAKLTASALSTLLWHVFGNIYSVTVVNVLASRSICHRPSRFSKIEIECPAIFVAGSPFLGDITRVDSTHI